MSLKQRPSEAVNHYHLRMQGILQWFLDGGADVLDAFLKVAFVDSLRTEFRDWMVPRQPEALDEIVTPTLTWERAEGLWEVRRAAKAASGKYGFCGKDGREEAQCEVPRKDDGSMDEKQQ